MVSCQSFEWSITTLSTAHAGLPLTVGTSLGIHLYDYRARDQRRTEVIERVDSPSGTGTRDFYEEQLRQVFDDDPLPPYASLSQPTPLSILHLPRAGSSDLLTDDVCCFQYSLSLFSHPLWASASLYCSSARRGYLTSLAGQLLTLDVEDLCCGKVH